MNLKQIAEGYINLAAKGLNISDDTIEDLSKKRMEMCIKCPSFSSTSSNCAIPAFNGCCGFCGCYMQAKTRSLSAVCGDKENPKW